MTLTSSTALDGVIYTQENRNSNTMIVTILNNNGRYETALFDVEHFDGIKTHYNKLVEDSVIKGFNIIKS
jgi:hypothetical protein